MPRPFTGLARPMAVIVALAGAANAEAEAPHAGAPDAHAAPAPSGPFESEIKAFEQQDRTLLAPSTRVVFIGSSSIRLWETLDKDFPRHRLVNRGFGGSQIADSVLYADRILARYKPPAIVMYAGGNDIAAGKRPETVAADFKAFTTKVWSSHADTTVAFISIAPNPSRWSQAAHVREANRLIAAYCATDKRLRFIDVFSLMLGADGKPRPELFLQDGLHMNHKGYELWIPPVRQVLDAVEAGPHAKPAAAP